MFLPVEGAVAALEAAVLAAVVVGGLEVVDVVVLDVAAAGRDVGGAVAGLRRRRTRLVKIQPKLLFIYH